ncbi:MAG: hypothetical protein HY875_14735 [Chloroflexi bacterium]|nr:hypothetical protein [Chloroflexota bacterium]
MLVKGDAKCLHCGFVTGSWVGPKGAAITLQGLDPARRPAGAELSALVRCGRCDGPVFLEDADPVVSSHRLRRIQRLREQIAAFDARSARAA